MPIPDFLKRENMGTVDSVSKEFDRVLKEYEILFGTEITTEMSLLSIEEWIEILRICIKEKKTYEELTGDVLEEDVWL